MRLGATRNMWTSGSSITVHTGYCSIPLVAPLDGSSFLTQEHTQHSYLTDQFFGTDHYCDSIRSDPSLPSAAAGTPHLYGGR